LSAPPAISIRTGLIGHGLGGRAFHEPLIRATPRLELAAIATTRSAPDPAGLIADPGIGLIVISTPNKTHYPLAKAALEAGKHVVIDKPFTVTLDEADELIALAGARQLVLTIFHNRRWDGDFLTVRKLLESGMLGELLRYEAHWDRFRPAIKPGWKERAAPGAGVLSDLGPHLVDQALLLFGAPDRVTGDVEKQRAQTEVEDYFAITLGYGRSRALLTSSLLAAAPRPRFALHGTGGSFVKYGLDPQEPQALAGMTPDDPAFGVEDECWHGTLTRADGSAERIPTERGYYLAFYEGVAAAILDGAPVPVDPADARAGLEIIELARASAREERPHLSESR
jgi:scyllo-inositol 2-dehydrogenase (NADP+)